LLYILSSTKEENIDRIDENITLSTVDAKIFKGQAQTAHDYASCPFENYHNKD
jgi:hypothetical protein